MKIPFYGNKEDDLHCMQACMKMILKYYYPEKDFSFDQLDELLDMINRKMYCFPDMAVTVLSVLGIDAKYYTTANDKEWYEKGKEYLLENYPKNVAEKIWRMSNIEVSKPFFEKALKEGRFVHKKLTFEEIDKFFREGCLISPIVNVNVFENKEGYAGHAILITDIDENYVTVNDPGLPPIPNEKIKKEDFIKSWESPGTDNTVLIVFGRKVKK